MENKEYILSLEKGLSILQCFSPEHTKINISVAAEKCGLTRAAARRYLFTLEQLGYIEKDDKYYFLTAKVLGLSGAYFSTAILPKISQPLINALTGSTNLGYSVSLLDGYNVITIARSTNLNEITKRRPYGMHIGNRLPSHATSAGKLLLAYEDIDTLKCLFLDRNILKITPYTLCYFDALYTCLQEIKEIGWCYSAQEHELGIHALAVPIFDSNNKIIAALNVVSSMNETTKEYLVDRILPNLLDTAYEIRKFL